VNIKATQVWMNTDDLRALKAAYPELYFDYHGREQVYDYVRTPVIVSGDSDLVDEMVQVFCKPRAGGQYVQGV